MKTKKYLTQEDIDGLFESERLSYALIEFPSGLQLEVIYDPITKEMFARGDNLPEKLSREDSDVFRKNIKSPALVLEKMLSILNEARQ